MFSNRPGVKKRRNFEGLCNLCSWYLLHMCLSCTPAKGALGELELLWRNLAMCLWTGMERAQLKFLARKYITYKQTCSRKKVMESTESSHMAMQDVSKYLSFYPEKSWKSAWLNVSCCFLIRSLFSGHLSEKIPYKIRKTKKEKGKTSLLSLC